MATYKLPNIHQQDGDCAPANFEKAETVLKGLVLTPEQIEEMNVSLAKRRAEFKQRIRNLNEAVNVVVRRGSDDDPES